MEKYKRTWFRNAIALACTACLAIFSGCGCVETGEEFLHLVFDKPVAIEEADSSAHILALELDECD